MYPQSMGISDGDPQKGSQLPGGFKDPAIAHRKKRARPIASIAASSLNNLQRPQVAKNFLRKKPGKLVSLQAKLTSRVIFRLLPLHHPHAAPHSAVNIFIPRPRRSSHHFRSLLFFSSITFYPRYIIGHPALDRRGRRTSVTAHWYV